MLEMYWDEGFRSDLCDAFTGLNAPAKAEGLDEGEQRCAGRAVAEREADDGGDHRMLLKEYDQLLRSTGGLSHSA